ncbi:MAG: zinc ABC transporter substrate-binding protein [Candidatus Thermoplasmatota archaeon]|nr:zinc ABC transporter substrate-binding protein [Candidatus Thermoplasmatota archaeon]
MSRQTQRALFASLMMILASLAGCLGNDTEVEDNTVMVSTYHISELVSAVGGDLVNIEMMSMDNIPVHDYQPSPQDIIRLQNADVFFYHGLGLEPWVDATLASMGADAPLAASTHAMPSGMSALDFDSLLIDELCGYLNGPSTTDVHLLAEHAEDGEEIHGEAGAYNLAMPEHHDEDEDHHEEDDHDEDEHDHDEDEHDHDEDEHDHGGADRVRAEETLSTEDSDCPAGTTVSVYHLEEGEYVFEFEAEDMASFTMAMAAKSGAHDHAHDHGDEDHDEHGDEDHDEHGDEDHDEDEGEHDHGDELPVCHEEATHENHDEYTTKASCEAAGYLWLEADEDDLHAIMESFDANNDSSLSLEEFLEGMEAMEEDHDHDGEASNQTAASNETEHEHDARHELEVAMWTYLFDQADTDNNSLLSMAELEGLDEMMDEDEIDAEAMAQIFMTVFDEDNNGSLSSEEFSEMMGVMMTMDEDDHEHDEANDNETEAQNMTARYERMFTMYDANQDGSVDADELLELTEMMGGHDEDVGFIHVHVEREGDYGIALPEGVELHILSEGGHEGHDHGDHDEDRHDEDGHDEDEDGHDEDEDDHRDREEAGHDEDEDGHDEDDHDDHSDDEAMAYDPHSWLSPKAFSAQIDVVLGVMSTAFPDHADAFRANADAYKAELAALDGEFEAAFGEGGTCSENTVAANHNAYAYLADAYDLDFVTVHGLDPEGEPSVEDIAEVVERIEEDSLTVLFIEEYTDASAVDSLVAQTVSDDLEAGVTVLTLYTMEMAPKDASDDYLSLMTKNLENLKTGLGC